MSATDTYQLPDLQHEVAPAVAATAELRTAHLQAGRLVAAMDLGDAALWAGVDAVVAAISAEAYAVAAALSGRPPRRCAGRVPPVVRVRELAAAQRALFAQLDRRAVDPLPAAGP
jgi:hypothetical protein